MTLPEMIEHYFTEHLQFKSSFPYYQRLYRQHFSSWRDHPTPNQLRLWHLSKRSTPSHANKGLGFLRAAYSWGIVNGYWFSPNPATGIRRYPSQSRERVMTDREVAVLRAALPSISLKVRAFFTLLLLTGCRMSEARVMRHTDVDEDGRWIKRRTKNGRGQALYIPTQARSLMAQIPQAGEFVFMGCYGRCWSSAAVEKSWGQFRRALGLHDVWVHDFRRTLASRLYNMTGNIELVKACLNHYDGSPTATYVRLQYDKLAATLQAHADSLFGVPRATDGPDAHPPFHFPTLETSHEHILCTTSALVRHGHRDERLYQSHDEYYAAGWPTAPRG
ncbi:MAG: site-specific integrase [Nitrospiraceae bacterium]